MSNPDASGADPVDHQRAKLFLAVEDGAILHVDRQKKEAVLDHPHGERELVPYHDAARWVNHLHQMASRADADGDEQAAPSTELSRVVETDRGGTTQILSDLHSHL